MATAKINARLQLKNDIEENWNKATGFIPKKGEFIIYNPADGSHNNYRFKIGDDNQSVTILPFATIDAECLPTSNASAGEYGPASATTLNFGSDLTLPKFTLDTKGRVIDASNIVMSLPSLSVENFNNTTETPFRLLFYNSSSDGIGLTSNNGLRVQVKNGTTSTEGYSFLMLGNNIAKGTADNKYGFIRIYSNGTNYHDIRPSTLTSDAIHVLPNVGGTILNTGNTNYSSSIVAGTEIGTLTINGEAHSIYVPELTGDYLPLSGGTVNGTVTIKQSDSSKSTLVIGDVGICQLKINSQGISSENLVTPGTGGELFLNWTNGASVDIGDGGLYVKGESDFRNNLNIQNDASATKYAFLKSENGSGIKFYGPTNTNVEFNFNKTGGILVTKIFGSQAEGNDTQPVYINERGLAVNCLQYAGGTSITLNGTDQASNAVSFYAPITEGVNGQVLISKGSNGAPTWGYTGILKNGGTINSEAAINGFITSGYFRWANISSSSELSLGFNRGQFLSLSDSSNYGTQLAIKRGQEGLVKIRTEDNGTWGEWHTILHSGNYSDFITSSGGASGNYLPLSAGVEYPVTGTLVLTRTQSPNSGTTVENLPALVVGGTNTQAHMEISSNHIMTKNASGEEATLMITAPTTYFNGTLNTEGLTISAFTGITPYIKLYGAGGSTQFSTIYGSTTNSTFYFPNIGGTLVTHPTRGEGVGGVDQPVYISSNGQVKSCLKYGGGNLIALNGSTADHAGEALVIYAPPTPGTAGQILYSNGEGKAPEWRNAPSGSGSGSGSGLSGTLGSDVQPVYLFNGELWLCKNYAGATGLTLNGESMLGYSASIYAPIASGTAGQVLYSNGVGKAPTWKAAPSGSGGSSSVTMDTVSWSNGTTAGPGLTVTLSDGSSASKAIPAASANYSGVVTTGAQTFSGTKTFNSGSIVITGSTVPAFSLVSNTAYSGTYSKTYVECNYGDVTSLWMDSDKNNDTKNRRAISLYGNKSGVSLASALKLRDCDSEGNWTNNILIYHQRNLFLYKPTTDEPKPVGDFPAGAIWLEPVS